MLKGSWGIAIIFPQDHQMVNEGTFETLTNEHSNFPIISKRTQWLNCSTRILEAGLPITKNRVLLGQFCFDKPEPLLALQQVWGRILDKAVIVVGNMVRGIVVFIFRKIFPDGFVDARMRVIP